MSLPNDAELLGTNSGELEIKGSGAHTVVRLTADGRRKLIAGLRDPAAASLRSRVYLMLENIHGTNDASVLSAYINLPHDARPGEHRDLVAGAVGLYGLRRASIRSGANEGSGLTFMLDITKILDGFLAANSLDADAIRVSIVPHRDLGDSADIVIGRVSIFSIPPK